jgi:LysM repeat protein
MKRVKKAAIVGALMLTMAAGHTGMASASTIHTAVPGDTYWKISQRYGVSLNELLTANGAVGNPNLNVGQKVIIPGGQDMYRVQKGDTFWIISNKLGVDMKELMRVNEANESTVLYIGQMLKLPDRAQVYTVKAGDTLWTISKKLGIDMNELMRANGATQSTVLYPGMTLRLPSGVNNGQGQQPPQNQKPSVTYTTHTVKQGDDFWKLGLQYGVPYQEILEANGLKESSTIYVGQKLKIPVHHVPIKATPGPQYGELLDWWTEAQYVWPIGVDARIVDFYTGVSWNMRRTIGAYHADVEPITAKDAQTMKSVWGGAWSWDTRPVIVEVNGRRLAASASAMPHDIEYISGNGFDGHSDIHFLNSTRHKDGKPTPSHQKDILIAAGK